jgi:hypothetical protein
MAVDCNQAGAPNYFPNSFSGPSVDPTVALHKFAPSGDVARYNSADEDNFTQVRREKGERRRGMQWQDRERGVFQVCLSPLSVYLS